MAKTLPFPGKDTPSTDGALTKDLYSAYGEPFELSQRVEITSGDASERLEVLIPPYSMLLSAQIKNASATSIVTGSSSTNAPDFIGLVVSTASSMSTSVLATTTGTSYQGLVAVSSTSTSDNAVNITPCGLGYAFVNGTTTADIRTTVVNLTSSWAYGYLVPVNNATATDQARYFVASGGFTFGADQSLDVVLRGSYLQPTAD